MIALGNARGCALTPGTSAPARPRCPPKDDETANNCFEKWLTQKYFSKKRHCKSTSKRLAYACSRLNKCYLSGTLLFICLLFFQTSAYGEARPKVVASFSILGDLVAQVGGDRIDLHVLVGPNQDAHVYQPQPADSARISGADLVVVNGLGFEGWIDRLIQASGYQGLTVVATEGLPGLPLSEEWGALEEEGAVAEHGNVHGKVDPHAWQSPKKVRRYIHNILQGLTAVDPAGADEYRHNTRTFLRALRSLEQEITEALAAIPEKNRTVVTNHDAFAYFGKAYGLTFVAPQGMSTDSEVSARDLANLIKQIRREKIPALFLENITDRRLLDLVAKETDARIGGILYSDALSAPDGDAGTYLTMMRHNLHTLVSALQPHDLEEQ